MAEFWVKGNMDVARNNMNIGHFLHEYLFYAYESFVRDPNILWVIDNKHLHEWPLKLTVLLAEHIKVKYEFRALGPYRFNNPDTYGIPKSQYLNPFLRNINDAICNKFPEIEYDGNYKVLYFREEMDRRRMVNYHGHLNKYFDKVVSNLGEMSFDEQVKMFMKCSHFVTIEGASLTNVIFMNKSAKVLDITPCRNSWQLMLGTARCVTSFEELILNLPDFNGDIVYSEDIDKKIKDFLDIK